MKPIRKKLDKSINLWVSTLIKLTISPAVVSLFEADETSKLFRYITEESTVLVLIPINIIRFILCTDSIVCRTEQAKSNAA